MSEPIRVVIADDHAQFLDGLCAMLTSADGIEVVGTANDGAEVVTLALRLQPDVILMDVQMPSKNGIEATRQIVYASPHINVIMLTMFDDDDSVFGAMRAGARGYLLKGTLKSGILRAIRAVAAGEAIFGAGLARRMINYFATIKPTSLDALFPELTAREIEVLELLALHLSNQEIAERLSISLKTARNHVSNILNKLQVADRTQAALKARSVTQAKH